MATTINKQRQLTQLLSLARKAAEASAEHPNGNSKAGGRISR